MRRHAGAGPGGALHHCTCVAHLHADTGAPIPRTDRIDGTVLAPYATPFCVGGEGEVGGRESDGAAAGTTDLLFYRLECIRTIQLTA